MKKIISRLSFCLIIHFQTQLITKDYSSSINLSQYGGYVLVKMSVCVREPVWVQVL